MNEFTYQKFLEDKLKDQHTNAHLLEEDIVSFKQRNLRLLKDIAVLRKSEKDMKLRLKQMEEKLVQQQSEIKRLREIRVQKSKETTEKRMRQQKLASSSMDSKQIFKMYLQNTFPKYKGLLKKILKILYIMQDHENKQPEQKVKFYRTIFEKGVKRLLDWLFPKQEVAQNKKEIAENIVNRWKQKEKEQKANISKDNLLLLKQVSYLKQIESLEAQLLELNSSKKLLEGRLKTYERTTQVKGSEFVAHLKKMLRDSQQYEPEAYEKVQEIIKLFTEVTHLSGRKTEEENSQQKMMLPQIPLILTTNSLGSSSKKKPAPVLKKNVFGYYQDPQFAGNYHLAVPTRHVDCNKSTQTLSQDLCILTLHPVIMVTLIDASIKPQRTRHSLQHYVKIRVNDQNTVDSIVKQGLELVWNQPFLLKDYDFPFINVQLMHKSKGLRDYSLGGGKFSASSQEQKIVNVRKEKEFMGRVRFSISYPKGNIYQFKITSVLLEIPSRKNVLKQIVSIQFPYNSLFSLQFCLPEKIVYTDKSMIILENCEDKMEVFISKENLVEKVSLSEFTAKEGNKEVIVILDNQWKVIIQGEVYLLICEDNEPQRIGQALIEGGKGKFFSVRAPPPIVTVTYDKTTLHSNIKFPLVFKLVQPANSLSMIKQEHNRELKEERVEAITNPDGSLKLSQLIKAPSKIYRFFIETIEGQQVLLRHESHLFERLLKEVYLQISYKEDQVQQINYARKGKQQLEILYKQFTIQTKELMLNHYKVFSRHFKRIGFVKFKLGYTIYDNQLLPESLPEKREQISSPLPEGLYFLYLQLTNAHLLSKSSGSSYSCKINGFKTKEVKGNQPLWKEGFTFSFQLKDILQIPIQYEVTEHGTFGNAVIHQGNIVVSQKTLQMGSIMVALDEKGEDCLHFNNIRLPKSIFHVVIDSIQGEIEEEADWIGKIDPYLTMYSQNREMFKTEYLDNIGSHPLWDKINQQFFISSKENVQQRDEDILTVKICDYDLIGRDDYIGEVLIGTKLNSELLSDTETEVLHGNIVKDNKICGSLKLRGKFKRIFQQRIFFPGEKLGKLTKKDVPYRLVLYALEFNQLQDYEGDQGWINLVNEVDPTSFGSRKCEFTFDQKELNSLHVTLWNIKPESYTFSLERQYKSFFKTTIQTLGRFTITARDHFSISKAEILDENKHVVGYCHYFIEFISKVKYGILSYTSLCKQQIKLKSDLDDQITLDSKTSTSNVPKIVFYYKDLHGEMTVGGKVQRIELKKKDNQDIYSIVSDNPKHQDDVAVIKLQTQLLFESQLQERSETSRLKHCRQFKKIKYLHWQPYRYSQFHSYKLTLRCTNNQFFEIIQDMPCIYNDHLILKDTATPIIVDSRNPPESIIIQNLNTNEEDRISLKDDITKIFIPNRGALYYHLEDYNSKSILELSFQYLFIRVKDIKAFRNFKDISAHLSTSLSSKTFTSKAIYREECFFFNSMTIYVPDPPISGALFFEGHFEGTSYNSAQRQIIMPFKFGLRLENNKSIYRFVDGEQIVVHAYFSCCLVERNYQVPGAIDNTIYGMSFIQLRSIEFEINEDPISKPIYLELFLNNQIEKIFLQRKGQSSIYRAQSNSIFFIESLVDVVFSLFEEGILSNSFIGSGSFTLVQHNVQKDAVDVCTEVKRDNTNIGRVTVSYKNIRQMSFIDVNLFSYISKSTQVKMKAQLQQIGPDKNKYQTINLTSRGNIPRLQSEDSFIVTSDPRNYQIIIIEQESKRLLGEFKLCHQLTGIGDKVTVLQPLRTSSDSLNGVLIIQYEKKEATSLALQKSKDTQVNLIEISISNLTFKGHYQKFKDQFSINLKTPARNLTTKPTPIPKPALQKPITFNLYSTQNCEITLLQKIEPTGSAFIKAPLLHQQQRITVFYHNQQAIGVCCLTIRQITSKEQLMFKREIVSLQASDLMDTEYFVKMKPYVDIQALNRQHWPCYRSDLGLGKENIYWKLGLITQQPIDLIFKDKDLFFDDLIGNAALPKLQALETEEKIYQLTLISTEGDNRKGGNGKIKVITHPVICSELCSSKSNQVEERIKRYLLKLGGFSAKNNLKLSQGQSLQISIGTNLNSFLLYQARYRKDIQYYLENKDVEVQFDTTFIDCFQSFSILITIKANQQMIAEQTISLKGSEKPASTEIFTLAQIIPVQTRCLSLKKVYFWMNSQLEGDVQVYAISKDKLQRLQILMREQRLIVVQPFQLIDVDKRGVFLLLVENQEEVCRLQLQIDRQDIKNQVIINRPVMNYKQVQIGFCYAEVHRIYSQGSQEGSKNLIGRSQKKWIMVTIVGASLTKDLQFFSKMDPYCKFTLDNRQNQQKQWIQTTVQENIGLKPIWNESYFLPLTQELQSECYLRLLVMDSEVTVDRKIGEGQALISLSKQNMRSEIDLYYSQTEKSGTITICSKVTLKYIVIRAITKANLESNSQHLLLIHQDNSSNRKGQKIEQGVAYPIDQQLPIIFQFGSSQKAFRFKELKEQSYKQILFEKQFVSIRFEIYDE